MSDYTDSINVLVKTSYLAEQSIEHQQYVFAYTITIENTGDESVQLLSRSWLITDADGGTTNVEGEGVVGQKPHIAPTKSYTYTSGSAFKTPVGTMQGYYVFATASGKEVKANIPVFTLAKPNILN